MNNGRRKSLPFLLDHQNPYRALDPFRIGGIRYPPFKVIGHNFFTAKEMDWLINCTSNDVFLAEQGDFTKYGNDVIAKKNHKLRVKNSPILHNPPTCSELQRKATILC